MKYFLLTSSIFYLLGLKFTSNIDLKSKFQTDSTTIKTEVIKQPVLKQEAVKEEIVLPKQDSIATAACGSDEMLAPFYEEKTN